MAKDPATLWYWNDWIGGTITLSRHIKGCYMDLLGAQFNNGRLSLEQIKTVLGSDFGLSWPALQKKFIQDSNGLWYNEKAEITQKERSAFTESRRKNLQSKKNNMEPHMLNHMATHMEIESENENRIENSFGESENLLSPFVQEAAERNQLTHTGNKNSEFVLAQWEIFLLERKNDPPHKRRENKDRLGEYFLNWIRNKFPKKELGKKVSKMAEIEKQLEKHGNDPI